MTDPWCNHCVQARPVSAFNDFLVRSPSGMIERVMPGASNSRPFPRCHWLRPGILAYVLLLAPTFLHAIEIEPIWASTNISGAVWDFTQTTNAVCVFVNDNGSFALLYIDRSTGVLTHVTALGADIEGPIFHGGRLYFLRSSGMLAAIDVNTGQPVWKDEGLSIPSAAGWGSIKVQDGRLIVRGATGFGGDSKEWVQIREAVTGQLIWKLDPGTWPGSEKPYAKKFCTCHETLCAVAAKDSEAGGLRVYEVPSLAPLWSKTAQDLPDGELLELSFTGGALCASGWELSSRGWFVMWEGSTRKRVWDVAAGGLPGWINSFIRMDDVIVFQGICPDEKGTWIEGRRWNSGERLWQEILPKTRVNSEPLKLSAELALFCLAQGERGRVECRNVGSGRVLWTRALMGRERQLVNEQIIIADGSRLVCLAPSDGKVVWLSRQHNGGAESAIGRFQIANGSIYAWGRTHYLSGGQRIVAAANPHLVEGRDEYWLERYPLR